MKVFIIAVIIMVLVEVLFIMYSDPTNNTVPDPVYLEEDYKHDHIVLWDLISRIPVTEVCKILKKNRGLRQVSIKSYAMTNNRSLFTTDTDGVLCFACHYIENCCKKDDSGVLECSECPVKWTDGSSKVVCCMEDNSTYILWIEQIAYMSDLLTKCDYDCTDLEVLATYERMCELARTIRDSWRD